MFRQDIISPAAVAQWIKRCDQTGVDLNLEDPGSNPAPGKPQKKKKFSREASRSHDLDVARLPESVRRVGPKHLSEGGFFSEDFLLLLFT